MKPMVPSADERVDNAKQRTDGAMAARAIKRPYEAAELGTLVIVERPHLSHEVERAYLDGHAAGFAEALEMAAKLIETHTEIRRAGAGVPLGQETGLAPRIKGTLDGMTYAAAIRSLATAPTGEKEGS